MNVDMGRLRFRSRATDSGPAEVEAVARVDASLAVASSRGLFTRPEAMELLRDIEHAQLERGDPGDICASRIAEIVAAADAACVGELMVTRSSLVDALLDIRLVIAAGVAR
jgi:hypothetical protein